MSFPLMPLMPLRIPPTTTTYLGRKGGNVGFSVTGVAESPNRYIVFASSSSAAATMTSCTINGINAVITSIGNSTFAVAKVPTGTTITSVATYSSGAVSLDSSSAVMSMYSVDSLLDLTIKGSYFNTGNPASINLDMIQDGLIIAIAWISNDNQNPTYSEGMIEDFGGSLGNSRGQSGGHRDTTNISGAYNLTLSVHAGTNYLGAIVLR